MNYDLHDSATIRFLISETPRDEAWMTDYTNM